MFTLLSQIPLQNSFCLLSGLHAWFACVVRSHYSNIVYATTIDFFVPNGWRIRCFLGDESITALKKRGLLDVWDFTAGDCTANSASRISSCEVLFRRSCAFPLWEFGTAVNIYTCISHAACLQIVHLSVHLTWYALLQYRNPRLDSRLMCVGTTVTAGLSYPSAQLFWPRDAFVLDM